MSWSQHLIPMLLTIVLWWGSTGVIARLVGRPASTYPRLILLSSVLGLIGLVTLFALREVTSLSSALVSLIAALTVWAWIEVTFLTGKVTGPSVARPASDAALLPRAGAAFTAILWHELLIAATVSIVAVALLGHANDLGLLVLLLLWLMRSSAKLNLFLGVRNLGEGFLPEHLHHLLDFMRQRRMNPLLPLSILLGLAIAGWFGMTALATDDIHQAAASTIVASLALLAAFEHLLMVLPLPAEALWRWSLSNRRTSP
jgi:putative photosynthetic complex assembly protein 2